MDSEGNAYILWKRIFWVDVAGLRYYFLRLIIHHITASVSLAGG